MPCKSSSPDGVFPHACPFPHPHTSPVYCRVGWVAVHLPAVPSTPTHTTRLSSAHLCRVSGVAVHLPAIALLHGRQHRGEALSGVAQHLLRVKIYRNLALYCCDTVQVSCKYIIKAQPACRGRSYLCIHAGLLGSPGGAARIDHDRRSCCHAAEVICVPEATAGGGREGADEWLCVPPPASCLQQADEGPRVAVSHRTASLPACPPMICASS